MPVRLRFGRQTIILPMVYETSSDTLNMRDGQVRLQGSYQIEIRYSFTAAGIGAMSAIGASTAASAFTAAGTSSLAAFSAGDLIGSFTAAGTSSLTADISGAVGTFFVSTGVSSMTVDARISASAEFTAIGTSTMFGAVEGATEISGFFVSAGSSLAAFTTSQLPFEPVVVPDTPTVFAADVATFQDATGWDTDAAQTINTAGIGLSSWDGTQTTNTNIYRNPTPLVSGRDYAVMLSAKTTNGFVYGRVAGDGFYQTNSMGINNTAFFPFTAPGNCTDVGFRVNPDFDGDIDTVQYYDLQFVKDRPKDIYITAGQSNMAAGSAQTGFDAFTAPKEPRALYVSGFERSNQGAETDGTGAAINAAWDANYGIGVPRLCAEPLPQASVCLEAIGPVTNIATVICDSGTEAGRSPCFIGSAHGGTSLDTEWNKDDDARCYDLMVANVAAMLAENAGNRVAGLFWCQGESTAAAGYAAKFKAFVDDLRSLWGEFPVVIMEIGEDDADAGVAAKIAEQQKCATGSGDASELTKCAYVVRPTGWALETDNIHFTGTTNLTRGTEAGQAMIPLLGGSTSSGEPYVVDGYVDTDYVELVA